MHDKFAANKIVQGGKGRRFYSRLHGFKFTTVPETSFVIGNFKGGLGQNLAACGSECVLLSEGNPVHFNSSFI